MSPVLLQIVYFSQAHLVVHIRAFRNDPRIKNISNLRKMLTSSELTRTSSCMGLFTRDVECKTEPSRA